MLKIFKVFLELKHSLQKEHVLQSEPDLGSNSHFTTHLLSYLIISFLACAFIHKTGYQYLPFRVVERFQEDSCCAASTVTTLETYKAK